MSKFNERFRYIKKFTGLRNEEIAKRLGIALSTVTYYLRDRDPSTDVLIKIADEFNVSINWLIGYPDKDANELAKENEALREKLMSIKELMKELCETIHE